MKLRRTPQTSTRSLPSPAKCASTTAISSKSAAHLAGDGSAVDFGHLVAGTEIVAVIALIDLRGHLRLEPALEANGGHRGFSNDREFVGQNILLLIGPAIESD